MITSCYVLMNELPGANFPGKSANPKCIKCVKLHRFSRVGSGGTSSLFNPSDESVKCWVIRLLPNKQEREFK